MTAKKKVPRTETTAERRERLREELKRAVTVEVKKPMEALTMAELQRLERKGMQRVEELLEKLMKPPFQQLPIRRRKGKVLGFNLEVKA
jgi:hypothetical protein